MTCWISGSTKEVAMSYLNIFAKFAVSGKGETIQKVSGTTSISSDCKSHFVDLIAPNAD